MKLDPRVRARALRLGALGLGLGLILGTWWGAFLAFLTLGVLALIAWVPWLGPRALARVGWSSVPVVGALVGFKASGVIGGAAVAVLVAGALFAPAAPPSTTTVKSNIAGGLSAPNVAATTAAASTSVATRSAPVTQSPPRTDQAAGSTAPPSPTASPAAPVTTAPATTAPSTTPPPTTARPSTPPPSTPPPTTAPPAVANLVITQLNYDGVVPRTESDEYVQITNRGGASQSMAGWRIVSVGAGQTYAFPNMTIGAGQTCRVYTNEIHAEWCSLSWGRGTAVWNNAGDRANLLDPSGRVVSTVGYLGY